MKYLSNLFKTDAAQSILVLSLLVTNGINFLYNAYLGKVLSVENFGLVTFINTLLYLITIIASAFASTATNRTGFIATHQNKSASAQYIAFLQKRTVYVAIILSLLWIVLLQFTPSFFHITELRSLFFVTPILLCIFLTANNRGYLMGNTFYTMAAILFLSEAIGKLVIALILLNLNLNQFVYTSIPLSLCISLVLSFYFVSKKTKNLKVITTSTAFPKRFFTAALLTGISTTGFLSLDIVLVKHFFTSFIAGQYALLSLTGKMIFFMGTLVNNFIITFASRDLGEGKNPNKRFYKLLLVSFTLTAISYLLVGILGFYYLPKLFGNKIVPLLPYLPTFGLAIALFTLSNAFTLYHLTRHHFTFSLLSLLSFIALTIGIYFYHQTLTDVVDVLLTVSASNFTFTLLLHFLKRNGKFILRNLIDLVDLFRFTSEEHNIKKRRILIFNWRDTKHVYAGGAEVYIHELAKRWARKGHKVTLFCGNDGSLKRREVVDGVSIIRRGGFYFVYFWGFWYYLMHFRGKYDVIIDTQNGIPFFTPLFAKEKIYCLMFHVHQEVFFRSLSKPLAMFASILENRLMPWAYRNTHFITISASSKNEIQKLELGKVGITIIAPGIDTSFFIPKQKSKKPLIAYVGRLQFYKSLHVFIQAAKMLLEKFPSIEFVIAGDGEEKESLKELAQNLAIDKKITFLGKVEEKEKVSLYQKAWVFVNPSYKEGWGITTIEANACATPVVASNVAGLCDSVKNPHTGYLVEYGNPKAFAEKIEKLVTDTPKRKQMEKNAVSWAKKFNWEASAAKGMKLLL